MMKGGVMSDFMSGASDAIVANNKNDMVAWERERVAAFLLSERHFISALELHQDLLEQHGESVEELQRFFDDPNNALSIYGHVPDDEDDDVQNGSPVPGLMQVPSPYQGGSTLDALVERDEKIVLLEYDLRCAKMDINELREYNSQRRLSRELSPASPVDTPLAALGGNGTAGISGTNRGGGNDGSITDGNASITELERSVLNVMVQKYLKDNGYKLAAITFSDEVGSRQDLGNVESLNLHIGKRASLLHLYRNRITTAGDTLNLETELYETQNELDGCQDRMRELEEEVESLRGALAAAKRGPSEMVGTLSLIKATVSSSINSDSPKIGLQTGEGTMKSKGSSGDLSVEVPRGGETPSSQQNDGRRSPKYQEGGEEDSSPDTLHNYTYIEIVKALADSLPSIVNHVQLDYRFELIPWISIVTKDHPDYFVREKLITTLITLKKNPNRAQRQAVVDAFVEIASSGSERIEHEVLPTVLEHYRKEKYKATLGKEQKILIARVIGILSSSIRTKSLPKLLSALLKEHLSDDSEYVRGEVMATVIIILKRLSPKDELIDDVYKYTVRLLRDKAMADSIVAEFIPLALFFLKEGGVNLVFPTLLNDIVTMLITEMSDTPSSDQMEFLDDSKGKDTAMETKIKEGLATLGMSNIKPVKLEASATSTIEAIVSTFGVMLPALYDFVLADCPPLKMFKGVDSPRALLNAILMGSALLADGQTASNVKWIGLQSVVNVTITLVGVVSLCDKSSGDGKRLQQLVANMLHNIGKTFGAAFVGRISYPLFLHLLGIVGKTTSTTASSSVPDALAEDLKSSSPPMSSVAVSYDILTAILGETAGRIPVLTQYPLEPGSAAPRDMALAERVLSAFASGILLDLDARETQDFLRRSLSYIAEEKKGWTQKQFHIISNIFIELCKNGESAVSDSGNLMNTSLSVLKSLGQSTRSKIRLKVTQILGELVNDASCSANLLVSAVSLLSGLVNDNSSEVRGSVAKHLGTLIGRNPDASMVERLKTLYGKLSQDDDVVVLKQVVRPLVGIVTACSPQLREGLVLETLELIAFKIVSKEIKGSHEALEEVASVLINVIGFFSHSPMSMSIAKRLLDATDILVKKKDLLDEGTQEMAINCMDTLKTLLPS